MSGGDHLRGDLGVHLAAAAASVRAGLAHGAYRDGMEDQLGALGLVLNAIVLWTTKYIDAAVAQLQAEGHEPGNGTSPGSPRSSTAT